MSDVLVLCPCGCRTVMTFEEMLVMIGVVEEVSE